MYVFSMYKNKETQAFSILSIFFVGMRQEYMMLC